MAILHFLNVRNGDCSIIQHLSGRVTMVDVNNARIESDFEKSMRASIERMRKAGGNFNQKSYPKNPIEYMQIRGIDSIFRFILTHPDMDHMDGIADLFQVFSPANFWDTDNTCDKDNDNWESRLYRREDWELYKRLRSSATSTRRLAYVSGQPPTDYWKYDGLTILAPTGELLNVANRCGKWNDSSYVLLYRSHGFKAILAGDSHDGTWRHILKRHGDIVGNVDVLVAPHHGRHSDRDFSFLNVLRPKLTLFGNASSEHLAYQNWSSRGLRIITNNQGGSIIVDFEVGAYYVTNQNFARAQLGDTTYYENRFRAWLCGFIPRS